MEDLQDKIIELMDLFDDEVVTTADKIDRPERALEKEAIDDFMKRNPMAGGGRIPFEKAGEVKDFSSLKNIRLSEGGNFRFDSEAGGKFFTKTFPADTDLKDVIKFRDDYLLNKGIEPGKIKKGPNPKRGKYVGVEGQKHIKFNGVTYQVAVQRMKDKKMVTEKPFYTTDLDEAIKVRDERVLKSPPKVEKGVVKPDRKKIQSKIDKRRFIQKVKEGRKNIAYKPPKGYQVHHLLPLSLAGPDTNTRDLAVINAQMNKEIAQFDKPIKNLTEEAALLDYNGDRDNALKRLKEINQELNDIVKKGVKKLGPEYKGLIGFNELVPVYDANGVVVETSYKPVGVDFKKSIAKNINIPEKVKNVSTPDLQKLTAEAPTTDLKDFNKASLQKLAVIGCPGKAMGGRIGFNEGQNLQTCALKGIEKLKGDPGKLTPGDQANLRAISKSAKAARLLKNVLGPAAIAGEVLIEGGIAANKFMSEGVPIKQALGQSYLNYLLGPKTKIDVEAERAKEFAKGEDFAMAKRGERMRPFMAQSATADAQRLKKREEEMKALYPQLDMVNLSNKEIDTMLADRGVYSPFTLGFGMQQRQPGIGDMRYSEDMAYDEIRDIFNKGAEESIREQQMKNIADAGGVANLAKGGRAGFKLGSVRKGVLSLIDDSLKKTPKDTTTRLDKLIKKTLDEDLFDKKDRIVDSINIPETKKRKNYPYNMRVFEEPKNLDFYDAITKSNFKTKTGPYYDRIRRLKKAGGGLLKQAGDRSGPPPESGPNPQGLQGLLNRVKKI